MATTVALTTVQKLYIAYYGRAADAAGQLFWADKLEAAPPRQNSCRLHKAVETRG